MKLEDLVITNERLGEGGFGSVFMCKLDGKEVVAKKLSQSKDEFKNLTREAAKLKRLQHGKHIAYTYGITSKGENLYMVMEYSEHRDLQNYLKKNKESVTYEQKILFCRGILLGLLYCHSMGIFHGDIKCSNVILGKNLEPKLTDFGLSMTVDNIAYYKNLCKGSLYWAAPELFSIKEDETVYREFIADPYSTDVYSLGATFCEISYDGTTEFINSDDPAMDIMLGMVSPTPKNAFLQEIVDGCCQFERNERISLDKCLSVLDNVAEEQFPIPDIDKKWQAMLQDIKTNSKLELPHSFILHRPAENLVVGPSNLSLLEWLCISNCVDSVKYMIQLHGCDQDQIKWLYKISEICKLPEVVDFLQTLMQYSEYSRLSLSGLINNYPWQFVEIVIKAGASSYTYDSLKVAIKGHHNIIVQTIIDNENDFKNRAIHDAVKFGDTKTVEIFANADADLEWKDDQTGNTPLITAIEREKIEVVKILLGFSVDVHSKNNSTQNGVEAETPHRPLYLAALKDNRAIVKLLIDAGATMDFESSEWHSLSQSLEQQGNISMVYFIRNSLSKNSSPMENPLCAAIRNKQSDLVQAFIGNKANVDEFGLDGYAPLHWAVVVGNEEIVRILIKAGADLDIRTSSKKPNLQPDSSSDYFSECTPLHIAISKGYLEIAKLLIESGADFSAKNGLQQTIIDIAKEDRKVLEKVIRGCAPVNTTSIRRAMKSMSPESIESMTNKQVNAEILSECLCIAASSGKNDIVEHLLRHGANIYKEYQNKTSFEWAMFGGDTQTMRILIESAARIDTRYTHLKALTKDMDTRIAQELVVVRDNVNARDKNRNSSIHLVESVENADILIKAGADVNAKGQYGRTPLIEHASKSNIEIVQLLVDRGADVDARDKDGKAAICHTDNKKIIEILINAGANISEEGRCKRVTLSQYVRGSNAKMVQFLVDKGADVNARDEDGKTLIYYANDKEIIKILINAGADVNAENIYGETLLTQFVGKSSTEMVKFLVNKGADVNARNKDGNAPIHYVKDKETAEILITADADINAKDRYGKKLFDILTEEQNRNLRNNRCKKKEVYELLELFKK